MDEIIYFTPFDMHILVAFIYFISLFSLIEFTSIFLWWINVALVHL